MGVGSLHRHVEHFAGEHVGGADTAGDHGGSGAVDSRVRSLGPAQAELHDAVALGRVDDALGLGGDQALVVDDVEQGRLHQLGLHDGGDDLHQGFPGEYDGALGDRVDIAGKAELMEIVQKVFLKHVQAAQIFDLVVGKMQVLNVLDHLFQPGADSEAVAVGIGAVKHIKDHRLVGVFFFKIPLHHGQLIQVGQ